MNKKIILRFATICSAVMFFFAFMPMLKVSASAASVNWQNDSPLFEPTNPTYDFIGGWDYMAGYALLATPPDKGGPEVHEDASSLQVTVSFGGASNLPGHMGRGAGRGLPLDGNYLGAGMTTTSFDSEATGFYAVDYGWSYVAYINNTGGPYINMEVWKLGEYTGAFQCLLSEGYYDPSISIDDDITLRMQWSGASVIYSVESNGVWSQVKTFDTTNWPTMLHYFDVGSVRNDLPQNENDDVKYFQLVGVWDTWALFDNPAMGLNWFTYLTNPQFMLSVETTWRSVSIEYTTTGMFSWLDNGWRWGSDLAPPAGIEITGGYYKDQSGAIADQWIKFQHTANDQDSTPSGVCLWNIPMQSITISIGSGAGLTNPSPGTYSYTYSTYATVSATTSSGYYFSHWSINGATSANNPITTRMMNNYSLTANFFSVPLISPYWPVMDVGQSQTLTSTVDSGSTPCSYQWYVNDNSVPGATSSSWTFTPSAAGAYHIYVKVTDASGGVATSNTATVTVNEGQLPASISAQVPITVAIIASDPSDTAPRYWGLTFDRSLPPLVSNQGYVGADANVVHHSGDVMTVHWSLPSGSHYLIFGVSQTGGPGYGSYSGTIAINGVTYYFSGVDGGHSATRYFASGTPTSVTIDVGQSLTFNSIAFGGTPPYSYQWVLDAVDVSGATSSSWTYSLSTTGLHTVNLKVTDNASPAHTVTTSTISVTVNTMLSVSISPSSASLPAEYQSQTFTPSISGGTQSFSCQWYLNDVPVTGAISPWWTFTPQNPDSYTIYLIVIDDAGFDAMSSPATVRAGYQITVSVQGLPYGTGVVTISIGGTTYTAYPNSPVTLFAWTGTSYTVQAEDSVWVWTGRAYDVYDFQSWSDGGALTHTRTLTTDTTLTARYRLVLRGVQ